MGASSATPCRAGTYNALIGQEVCLACPVGKYQSAAGETACMDCPAGSWYHDCGNDSDGIYCAFYCFVAALAKALLDSFGACVSFFTVPKMEQCCDSFTVRRDLSFRALQSLKFVHFTSFTQMMPEFDGCSDCWQQSCVEVYLLQIIGGEQKSTLRNGSSPLLFSRLHALAASCVARCEKQG